MCNDVLCGPKIRTDAVTPRTPVDERSLPLPSITSSPSSRHLPPTYLPANVRHRSEILNLVVLKGVILYLSSIETIHCFASDHVLVLLKLDSFIGEEQSFETKTIIDWKRVSTALEEVDTPNLNVIPDDIVPDRRGLPADVRELIRAKNAALRHASAYLTPEYSASPPTRSEGVREVKNDNWSTLMEQITPNHKAYWAVAKALKFDVCVAVPAFKKPDNNLAFDHQEKAEYIVDSIELQWSLNPVPLDFEHVNSVENEVFRRSLLPTKDDLPSVSADEVQKLIKELKLRKAPGLDGVNNKAIKCFSLPLLALLVAIFNACFKNCHFPEAWKEAVIIGIPKLGKPRNPSISYSKKFSNHDSVITC
ncbi:Probable RNA-directed DNA polymerase from transposon BS [Eumeta japonica]|uniref:Probable RNA-directed DNA polymerase from transposon BS n=1 Tax=Eumeta variegata TaxID=151549 RepID=A0A4C1UE44_EUMVA|nr:Probable RNA-directed DNA polymerase from transposon BS [Eumeta japonica]